MTPKNTAQDVIAKIVTKAIKSTDPIRKGSETVLDNATKHGGTVTVKVRFSVDIGKGTDEAINAAGINATLKEVAFLAMQRLNDASINAVIEDVKAGRKHDPSKVKKLKKAITEDFEIAPVSKVGPVRSVVHLEHLQIAWDDQPEDLTTTATQPRL